MKTNVLILSAVTISTLSFPIQHGLTYNSSIGYSHADDCIVSFVTSNNTSVSERIRNNFSISSSDAVMSNESVSEGINDTLSSYSIVGCDEQMSKEYNDNVRILLDIAKLEENWDGYGALPIPQNIITCVLMLLSKLERQPDIFPTPDGTLQLEYAVLPNRHLNIEFLSDTSMSIFEMLEDRSATESTHDVNIQTINLRVKKFYE